MGYLDLLREDASQTDIREHLVSGRPAAITIRIPETLRDAAKEKAALKGMSFSAACPKDYMPPKHIIEFGEKYGNGKFEIVTDPLEAAKNADIVYTDVWASMGQEEEKKIREAAFAGYQVNKELMAVTNKDCMVLHCLPAHRGEEITADVFEEHANEIFEEAENRLHAQKAVLVECMADEMPEKV